MFLVCTTHLIVLLSGVFRREPATTTIAALPPTASPIEALYAYALQYHELNLHILTSFQPVRVELASTERIPVVEVWLVVNIITEPTWTSTTPVTSVRLV